ncbi:hypothetical protein DTPHA_801243 [Enterococcus faecium]|nr:hypothetical protein DTPHA_801243 [Enterococcus faecium]
MIGEDKLLMTIQLTDLNEEEKKTGNKRLGYFDTSVDPANIYPLFHTTSGSV